MTQHDSEMRLCARQVI